MKALLVILFFLHCTLFAQKSLPLDSLQLKQTRDMFADDYGNIYLYKNQNFSVTKYDSVGKEQGRLMLTLPFKIQDVQNPLNIVLFSENAQQLKFVDQNLNEIQKIDLRKFGFIKMAYAEDQQQIWLLDESMKRLVQYNFREDKIINSYPFFIDFEKTIDMIVFENKLYLLTETDFKVYDFKANLLFTNPVNDAKKLRRENDAIFVIAKNSIFKFVVPQHYEQVFEKADSQIVDKNSSAFFEVMGGNLYLYKIR